MMRQHHQQPLRDGLEEVDNLNQNQEQGCNFTCTLDCNPEIVVRHGGKPPPCPVKERGVALPSAHLSRRNANVCGHHRQVRRLRPLDKGIYT